MVTTQRLATGISLHVNRETGGLEELRTDHPKRCREEFFKGMVPWELLLPHPLQSLVNSSRSSLAEVLIWTPFAQSWLFMERWILKLISFPARVDFPIYHSLTCFHQNKHIWTSLYEHVSLVMDYLSCLWNPNSLFEIIIFDTSDKRHLLLGEHNSWHFGWSLTRGLKTIVGDKNTWHIFANSVFGHR